MMEPGAAESTLSHDVFISHSAIDKAVADAVCHKLEEAGIRCWIAPRDLVPGMTWAASIQASIEAVKLLVVVFSAHANKSVFVDSEVLAAASAGKPILPFRIEDVAPSGDLKFHLASRHWLDAMTPPLEAHLDRLVSAIAKNLNGQSSWRSKGNIEESSQSEPASPLDAYLLDDDPGPIVPDWSAAGSLLPAVGPSGIPNFPPIKFPHAAGLYAATFSPSGSSIVTALKAGTETASGGRADNLGARAFVWNADHPKPSDKKVQCALHGGGVVFASFSPDCLRIATASEDGTARIWYAGKGGGAVGKPLHHDATVNTAHFSPDGLNIVTASWDGTAAVWDAHTGKRLLTLSHRSSSEDDDAVNSAYFSPRGNLIVTAAYNGTARVWDATTGQISKTFAGRHRVLCSAAWSSDGDRIVTSDAENGTSCVWDVATESVVTVLSAPDGHNAAVWSATFSTRGDKVVTASADFCALIWDVATSKILVRMRHPAPVITAYLTPDSTRVLTACDDGYAYLWLVA